MSMIPRIMEMMKRGYSFKDAFEIAEDTNNRYPNTPRRKRAKRMLRREDKIVVTKRDNNTFDVSIKNGKHVLGAGDDFFIYFKNVNLRADGVMEGRYLGEASDSLIDDYAKDVTFVDGKGFMANGELVRTARMVAVNNKTRAVIVIEN